MAIAYLLRGIACFVLLFAVLYVLGGPDSFGMSGEIGRGWMFFLCTLSALFYFGFAEIIILLHRLNARPTSH